MKLGGLELQLASQLLNNLSLLLHLGDEGLVLLLQIHHLVLLLEVLFLQLFKLPDHLLGVTPLLLQGHGALTVALQGLTLRAVGI